MMSVSPAELEPLRRRIAERIPDPLLDLRHYARGQNAELFLADFEGRGRVIVKTLRTGGDNPTEVTLEPEGWMLRYLNRRALLPVPHLYWYDPTMILMEFVESSGVPDDAAQRHAAGLLALLHRNKGDFFGFERDTTIGPWHQPNHYETDWRVFFRDHRLLYMARCCVNDGLMETSMMRGIERLAARLDRLIPPGAQPSLLHGDLWGGNVLVGRGQVAAFIDPALYFGAPEMDLAFIRLFGTFGDPFFTEYATINPVADGFEDCLRHIYGLYPLLVQARSVSPRYLDDVQSVVDRFSGSG